MPHLAAPDSTEGASAGVVASPSPSQSPSSVPPSRLGSGAMFDGIAKRYDVLNRVMSFGLDRRWRRLAVAACSLKPGGRILDLATGTADVALEVLRQQPDTTVVGLDPSASMLAVGERKVAAAGLSERLELRQGEAEELPFDDNSFDAAIIAWGIRNVADRPAALREMARVVKPAGRVVILESVEPRSGIVAPAARLYLHHVVPRLGAWLSREKAYRYLQKSIAAFPSPSDFGRVMTAAGLEVLAIRPQTFGVCCIFEARPAQVATEGEG